MVLFESKEFGWIVYSTIGSDAKRLLNVNNQYNIFYVFECDLLKQYPYTMKLKTPLNKHYNCKKINKYEEDFFEENDEYITISYETHEGICFDVKYY